MRNPLETLDFYHLKKLIGKHIQTRYGKIKLEQLKPTFNLETAKKNFQIMDRFFSYFVKWGSFTLDDIYVSDIVLGSFQSTLGELELKKIGDFLKQLNQIEAEFVEHDKILYEEFVKFDIPFSLLKEITNAIDEYGLLKDTASAHLFEIRQSKKEVSSNINRMLKNLMHSRAKDIIMDTAIFLKRNRYTLLLKPNYKEYISGRIIDIGKSGGLFVEPDAVYSLNNELEDLIAKEEAERRRILSNLTNMVRENASRIKYNEQRLGFLDLTLAKYFYSRKLPECELTFSNKPVVFARGAKHPILASIKKDTKPVDIDLKSSNGLIITGPNTGGKTVFLKTVGLIVLSFFSGIPIYAESLEIGPFDNVFAVIGDEQDIFESLSGFSSKIQAFKNYYEQLTKNSLMLLDEIGSGTSPDEGEAIAYAVIKTINNKCTFCATTHYKKLAYTLQSEGLRVAAFEFDPKTLKPTYKLTYGKIGRSYGIEILKSLGIDSNIVNIARDFYSKSSTTLAKLEEQLEKTIERYEKAKKELERVKHRYLELLNSEKQEKEKLVNELKEKQKQKKNEYEKLIQQAKQLISEIIRTKDTPKAHKKLSEIQKLSESVFIQEKQEKNTKQQFNEGDFVSFNGMTGRIINLKGPKATVEIEGKLLEVPLDKLTKTQAKETSKVKIYATKPIQTMELNLIGKRRDEAYMELVRFIDSLLLENVKRVRVVHGLGSGILKDMVRETLKELPHVKSFRPAPPNEGGDGATIVELD